MYELQFEVAKIEGSKVTLAINGQKITLPARLLPRDIKEGDVLYGELLTDTMKKERQKDLARAVLEEILNNK